MKTQLHKANQQGFTLVELLVVIVIISVLSTLGFSVGTKALQNARKVTALSAATALANGVEQFYSEYNLFPSPTATAPNDDNTAYSTTDTSTGVALLNVLAGYETNDEQNEREINCLNVKEADKPNRGGVVYNNAGNAVVGLYDPWGQPYHIVIDYDYDGQLRFAPSGAYTYNAQLNNKNVAVYSLGTDSPNDAKRNDLVKSW